jgi:hypothetical protein
VHWTILGRDIPGEFLFCVEEIIFLTLVELGYVAITSDILEQAWFGRRSGHMKRLCCNLV